MEPLSGRAEQISAKTAAVIHMKIMEMIYDDLDVISVNLPTIISEYAPYGSWTTRQ